LARLRLTVRRLGCHIQVSYATEKLKELLDLSGLSDVLALGSGLDRESRRQAEEREQAGGIEKEAEPVDPTL
jgi:hypothetical protein